MPPIPVFGLIAGFFNRDNEDIRKHHFWYQKQRLTEQGIEEMLERLEANDAVKSVETKPHPNARGELVVETTELPRELKEFIDDGLIGIESLEMHRSWETYPVGEHVIVSANRSST